MKCECKISCYAFQQKQKTMGNETLVAELFFSFSPTKLRGASFVRKVECSDFWFFYRKVLKISYFKLLFYVDTYMHLLLNFAAEKEIIGTIAVRRNLFLTKASRSTKKSRGIWQRHLESTPFQLEVWLFCSNRDGFRNSTIFSNKNKNLRKKSKINIQLSM
jgi:hypothetical protein